MIGWEGLFADPGPLILLAGVSICAALILQALVRSLIRSRETWGACRRAAERLDAGVGRPSDPPGTFGDAAGMLKEASGRARSGVPIEGAGAFKLLYSLVEAGDEATRDLNRRIAERDERRAAAAYLKALDDPRKPAVEAGPDANAALEVFGELDLNDRPEGRGS